MRSSALTRQLQGEQTGVASSVAEVAERELASVTPRQTTAAHSPSVGVRERAGARRAYLPQPRYASSVGSVVADQ